MRLHAVAVIVASLEAWSGQGVPSPVPGQSSKTWVGRQQEIEEHLRNGECLNLETFPMTKGTRCTFRPGGPIVRMIWRPILPGPVMGFRESYQTEIAAYELDKLLKMDMVPPTVERQLGGVKGSAQQWVENITDATEVVSEKHRGHWDSQVIRMETFDFLIGNRDRNLQNMLRDRAGNLILVDHSRAFGSRTDAAQKLKRIDRELWTRIEALTRHQLEAALAAWIGEAQIDAILSRRDAMRTDVKAQFD